MNAGNQRQIRKAKQRDRFRREQELNDVRQVASQPTGRRLLWRLLTQAGCYRQSFVQGEPDSTAFHEGRRSLGLMLMADVHEADPALYGLMAHEATVAEVRQADPTDDAPNPDPLTTTEEHDDA